MNAIEVKNLCKKFVINHEKHVTLKQSLVSGWKSRKEVISVLDDINFEVKQGEFFGIIGRNGCGKSTLLKILAKIYEPTSGSLKINGRVSPFLELGVGFQPELTAWENIFLYGTLLGLTEKEINKKINQIIEFAELEKFVDTKIKNFSSGMLVRLAFSVAIQADFDILLLDEVLAVGDVGFQQKCFDKFNQFKEQNKTIVLVSHSEGAIKEYCDRVILLENGRIIQEGAPSAVMAIYNLSSMENQQKKSEEKNKTIGKQKNNFTKIQYLNEKRWGTFELKIKELLFANGRDFLANTPIKGQIIIEVNNEQIISQISNVDLALGLYNCKDDLVCFDRMILKNAKEKQIVVPFEIMIPDLIDGIYRFSLHLSDKNEAKNGKLYDHWDRDNQIFIRNNLSKNPGIISLPSLFFEPVQIVGMIRMRNEELILKDTLDSFGKIVDKIIIYDDASTDGSVEIARSHPQVLEVIENKTWKKNRQEEETIHRQLLLEHAQKYQPSWCFYSDCDERFDGNIREFLLSKEAEGMDGIRISLFDAYITKEDFEPYKQGELVNFRKYFGPEMRPILMIWKNTPHVSFEGLDQREPKVTGNIVNRFYCQHYGKAMSVEQWEETCDYYAENFPEPYHSKWLNRKGKAIHEISDFGNKLYPWGNELFNNKTNLYELEQKNNTYKYISDQKDYRHLEDKELFKALYNEVGTVEANLEIKWREEWMKYFAPKPESNILELGAHNGPNMIHYAREGHEVTGVELSDTLIATFKKFAEKEKPEVQAKMKIIQSWIEEFQPTEKYDYVLCTEILEHVTDPIVILKKAQECLKQDGKVYISSPSTHWGNNTHVRGVPVDELNNWIEEAGLKSEKAWEEDGRTFAWAINKS